MRGALALVATATATATLTLAACGARDGAATSTTTLAVAPASVVPRLAAPPPIDLGVFGAGYLSAVALQFEPGWGQFLDDCRLRLPAADPLNAMTLSAQAELAVDRAGRVSAVRLARASGNAEFDRAVHDAIADADAARLPAPPAELVSDDEHVHLRWLFARDRRRAGPATAEVYTVREPLAEVTARLIADGDLGRAARRIAGEPAGEARTAAAEHVMIAALREALGSADDAVRRAAVRAIGRARVIALAPDVRGLLASTIDADSRSAATVTAMQLGDRDARDAIAARLAADLAERADDPQPAVRDTAALLALDDREVAVATLRTALAGTAAQVGGGTGAPRIPALFAYALAPVPELAGALAGWFAHGAAPTRAAVCSAVVGLGAGGAHPIVARGLVDADATVRATCIDTAARLAIRDAVTLSRLHAHLRDRDRNVRARAFAALAALDADSPAVRAAVDDPAPEVRVALAAALSVAAPRARELVRALAGDRDPDVRATALTALATAPAAITADDRGLALHAASDAAAQVRRTVPPLLADDAAATTALVQLAGDDAPDVRLAADVELARRRGRAAATLGSLARLAAAPRGSAERVRIALAWLLAS